MNDIELFERVLLEAKEKLFYYNGSNQNTPSAWIFEDSTRWKGERVKISDTYGSYEWDRKKSNSNVQGRVKDGKGFSFYFARYSYLDQNKYIDESYVTSSNSNYSSFLATVPFGSIVEMDSIKNDRSLSQRLSPKNFVLLIVDEIKNQSTNIVSATYTKDEEKVSSYIDNRMDKYIRSQKLHESQRWLGERLLSRGSEKLYESIIKGYDEFQKLLLVLKRST